MRARIVGAACMVVGAAGAWKNFTEGNVGFPIGAAVLAVAGAYYMVRPTIRVLGAVEVMWGVLIIVYFTMRGGGVASTRPVSRGRASRLCSAWS